MTSFFHSIRNYFSAGFHGRYFAILLRELAQSEPASFRKLTEAIEQKVNNSWWSTFSREFGEGRLNVKCEHEFQGANGKRRADIAVLRGTTPLLMLEVKEFDHLSPTNLDQVADYIRLAKNSSVGFICVYRFLPKSDVVKRIQSLSRELPVALMSYDEIHHALTPRTGNEASPVARLINAYLEDIGVGVYEEVFLKGKDKLTATLLLNQILGMPHRTRGGKILSDERVRQSPELLRAFLSNIEFIAEWSRLPNLECMPRAFNRRFWIDPLFDQAKLVNRIIKQQQEDGFENEDTLPRGMTEYVKGGRVYFEATGALKTTKVKNTIKGGPRLSLVIALALELGDAAKKEPPRCWVYASFGSFETTTKLTHDQTRSESNYLKSLSQEVVLRETSKVIGSAKTKALKAIANTQLGRDLQKFTNPIAP